MTPDQLRAAGIKIAHYASELDDPMLDDVAAFLRQCAEQKPVAWRDHVEQRMNAWRQRFVDQSDDQLALEDFMDERSLDDLIDYVCDEWEGPDAAPTGSGEQPEPTTVTAENVAAYNKAIDECYGSAQPEPSAAQIEAALRLAFELGKTYLAQAESESWSENKRSDKTLERFHALVAEFAAKEQK